MISVVEATPGGASELREISLPSLIRRQYTDFTVYVHYGSKFYLSIFA